MASDSNEKTEGLIRSGTNTQTEAVRNSATNSSMNDVSSSVNKIGNDISDKNEILAGIGPGGMSKIDYQTIKTASDTLRRNPKIEFSRNDLLKLLSYLEGELQAREVVVAVLKSEKLKHYLQTNRYKPMALNDPNAALFRDTLAFSGNIVSKQSSTMAAQSEQEMRLAADNHLEALENVIMQQRQTQVRMINVLRDAEEKHKKLVQELEDEKCKHERDTAQGDDIAYGLELERTKLKQELESEKNLRKKLEKDIKKLQEVLDNEKARQKQIVLLLLAERKKIIMKYVEERKRSEDLAQILSEEKLRVDTIAEGLEEESKKSLRMEAELEKQLYSFDLERKAMRNNIAKDEKRVKELELEVIHLKAENETLRKQMIPNRLGQTVGIPQLPMKPGTMRTESGEDASSSGSPIMSSVAKVVQPTATVSSVPVSGPTTGIARSISPGLTLRQTPTNDQAVFNVVKVPIRKLSNTTTVPQQIASLTQPISQITGSSPSGINVQVSSKQAVLNSPTPPQPPVKKIISQPMGRGVPPPIPPNKPVIPPKRDGSSSRLAVNNTAKEKDTNIPSTGPGAVTSLTTETLEDELHDFQQVLCSMTIK